MSAFSITPAPTPVVSIGSTFFTVSVPASAQNPVFVWGAFDQSIALGPAAGIAPGSSTQVSAPGIIWLSSPTGPSGATVTAGQSPGSAPAASLAITLTDANTTLSATQLVNGLFILSGTLTAQRNIVIPAVIGPPMIFENNANYPLQIIAATGTGLLVQPGGRAITWFDGTNVVGITQLSTGSYLSITVTGNIVLTEAQQIPKIINLAGTPGAGFSVTFIAEVGDWIIANNSGQTATIQTTGQGSPPTLATANHAGYYCDGTNMVQWTAAH